MSTSDSCRLLLMGGRPHYQLQRWQAALSCARIVEIWREAEGMQALRDALGRADAMIVGPEARRHGRGASRAMRHEARRAGPNE